MLKQRRWISLPEMLIGIAIFAIAWIILVQVISKNPPPEPSAVCTNHLRETGKALHLYAKEHGGRLPPIDATKNNFIFEGSAIYPEYLEEIDKLVCPADPELRYRRNFVLLSADQHSDSSVGDPHPDCITDMSYVYLGWMVTNDEEADVFFQAYDRLMPKDYDRDVLVPEGKGIARSNTIPRLSMDAGRFLDMELNTIMMGEDVTTASFVPIIWERPPIDTRDFNHRTDRRPGGNVLYLDGYVEFIEFEGFPMTETMARLLEKRPHESIPDCEG